MLASVAHVTEFNNLRGERWSHCSGLNLHRKYALQPGKRALVVFFKLKEEYSQGIWLSSDRGRHALMLLYLKTKVLHGDFL